MNKFKFHTECLADVMYLMDILGFVNIEINKDEIFPDCDVEVTTRLPLSEVIFAMEHVNDGHVMIKTIKEINEPSIDLPAILKKQQE